jgi:hypothetical protein
MAKRNGNPKPKLMANYNGWNLAKVEVKPDHAYQIWQLIYTKDFAGRTATSISVMNEEAFALGNLARNCVIQDTEYVEEEIRAGRIT